MHFRRSTQALLLLLVALLSFFTLAAHAGPLDSWQPRNPLPQLGNHLYGIASNGSTCVVVGYDTNPLPTGGGRIITSTDGYNWVVRASGLVTSKGYPVIPYGVAYGKGIWIAVASKGTILKSTDAVTWTIVNEGYSDDDELRGIAFGKGKTANAAQFVAVGKNGKILTSPNGDIWTYQVSPTNSFMNGITFANGLFVAVGTAVPGVGGSLAVIMTSANGTQWESVYYSNIDSLKGISYGNNLFVAVGSSYSNNSYNILVSADGYTWNPMPCGEGSIINGVAYGNDSFVAVSSSGYVLTSQDSLIWSRWYSGMLGFGAPALNGVTFFNNIFIAIGSDTKLLTSADGKSWTERPSGTSNFLYGIAYGKGIYAAVGWGGKILSSTDMTMWVERGAGTPNSIFGITFGNNKFVAVGSDGKIVTSSNGTAWTAKDSGFKDALFGIAYGNKTFVAVGARGKILTSADGLAWKSRASGTTDYLYGITYANNIFIAVGQNGRVLTSPDAITWTNKTPANDINTNCLYGATYGGTVFVFVGENGTILTSPDLTQWTKRSSSGNGLRAVTYADNTFFVLGTGGQILASTSPDASSWTLKVSGINYSLLGIAYAGNVTKPTLIAVGAYATILSSDYNTQSQQWDGWKIKSTGTYKCLKSIAYGDKTFVAVGETGTILTSRNGTTWDLQTLSLVSNFNGVSYGNGRFVAVGDYGNFATVYTSADNGVTWNKTFPPLGYTPFNPSNLYGITYGGGQFLVGGTDGIIMASPSGDEGQWWCAYLEACFDTKSVAYGDPPSSNPNYVMVGDCNRTFLTSEDPQDSWVVRFAPYIPQETKLGFTGIAYGAGIFTVVGPHVKIVISDPILGVKKWKQVALVDYTGTFDFTGITYGGNKTFTAAGTYGKILTSADGKKWTFRRSGTTKDLFGMIYGASSSGNTYIGVGKDGIILQSGVVP